MRIGMFTDSLPGSPLEDVLAESQGLGVRDLEIGTGSYSPAPHWSAGAWLPDYEKIFEWQWSERLLPYWHDMAAFAKAQGVARVCLELHPGMTVYNTYTLLRLRDAVGPIIAANLDPSHLFWQ